MSEGQAPAIILCPLVVEAAALRRSGCLADVADGVQIEVCGPGARGVEQWFARRPIASPIVLAGVAGALRTGFKAQQAYVISTVRSRTTECWKPTWPGPAEATTATVASSEIALTTPQSKRQFAKETEADLVDMEAEAFARAATELGVPWAILRGVSDGAEVTLPIGVDRWVDSTGHPRLGRVLLSLARRPVILGDLVRLQRDSKAAMEAVASIARAMVSTPPDRRLIDRLST